MYPGLVGITVTFADFNWPAQNEAIYIPLELPFQYMVKRVFWRNGSGGSGSNWDFGIHAADYTRIYSTTSTASSGNSLMQYVTLTDAQPLEAGQYYLSLANDNATLTNRGYGISTVTAYEGRTIGMFQQLTAFPIPNPMVPAQWASTGLPLLGICRTASGP